MLSIARRWVAYFSAFMMALGALAFSAPASAQIPYSDLFASQSRYAAIVTDANTGEVLYQRNADAPRHPASLTKLMTLYLTFEALQSGKLSLSDRVPISPHAAAQSPSKLGLRPGDSLTVDEAIRSMTVKSANDIAVAMAEKLGGTEARFSTMMTARAQELGMHGTQYVNASGLPDSRQITTARDLAILSRAIMRDFPQYYPYFSLRGFTFRGRYIPGHDHLLGAVAGVDGLKTGYTASSGFNLASSAVRDGRRIIGVVLGGSSVATRDQHMEDLLNTSFKVLRRRALGENVTVAQNLYEPAPTGPITRPATEQGDGDQSGVQIVLNDDPVSKLMHEPVAIQPAPVATSAARAELRPAVEHCREIRKVRVVRRHGRRVRISEVSRRCEGARLTPTADVHHCSARHRRHAHCAAVRPTHVAETRAHRHGRHHHRVTKVAEKDASHARRHAGGDDA